MLSIESTSLYNLSAAKIFKSTMNSPSILCSYMPRYELNTETATQLKLRVKDKLLVVLESDLYAKIKHSDLSEQMSTEILYDYSVCIGTLILGYITTIVHIKKYRECNSIALLMHGHINIDIKYTSHILHC